MTAVRELIKIADAQWISGTDYDTDDLGLDCKVGVAGGLVLDQCCAVLLQWQQNTRTGSNTHNAPL